MKTSKTILAAAIALAAATWAPAGLANKHESYAEGEVRKVDKEAGKVTLKHGPLANLDMPPMTMVFKAKEPAMLDNLKVGDKVRFRAEKVAGAYPVTEIRADK